jgi:hypothetical protein
MLLGTFVAVTEKAGCSMRSSKTTCNGCEQIVCREQQWNIFSKDIDV